MKIKNRLILFEILIMIKILTINSTNIISNKNINNENLKFQTKVSKKQNEFLSYAFNMVHNNDSNINAINSNNHNKKMDNKKLSSISHEVLEKPNFSVLASNILGEVRKQFDNNTKKIVKQQPQPQKKINSQGRVSLSSYDLTGQNHLNNSSRTPNSHKFGNYKNFNNYNETDKAKFSNNNTNEDLILKKQLAHLSSFEQNPMFENIQISYIEFDFLVNDFNNFEPKTGMISIDAKLKYKWWYYNNEEQIEAQRFQTNIDKNQTLNITQNKNSKTTEQKSFPKIEFKNKNVVKFKINNQFQKNENNYDEISIENPVANITAERLLGTSQNLSQTTKSKNNQNRKSTYLEQNVNLKFKCKNFLDSETDEIDSEDEDEAIDVSQFPFDVHRCSLEFDLIANTKNNSNITSIYLFPILKDTNQIDYFKLVKHITNGSLFTQEWVLKRVYINYFNSTSTLYLPSIKSNPNINNTFNDIFMTTETDDSFPINDYIMSLNLDNENIKKRRRNNEDQPKNSFLNNITPAKVSIDFLVYRRREPQIYLFILPLVILTLITFLIFFLPTTKGSEKSLIALLNCAFLITYNIYAFKMIVITYDITKIPLILKYSNCLMIIQLAVLAYTCLVKSIYLNGFLTFSSRTYMNASEELYNQIMYSNQMNQNLNYNNNSNNEYDTKKSDLISTSIHQTQTYCVSKAAAAHSVSNDSLLKNDDVIGKSSKSDFKLFENIKAINRTVNIYFSHDFLISIVEHLNAFGIIAATTTTNVGNNTTIGGTNADESNYTVYNNIDNPCDCSANDVECQINGTRDDNFCDDLNNIENNKHDSKQIEKENKNEYGMILDYKKSNNQPSTHEVSKPNWLFTIFCCATGLIDKLNSKHFRKNSKLGCNVGTLEYDYVSHLSRNINLPMNAKIAKFNQINSTNAQNKNLTRNFSLKQNQSSSIQPPLPPFPTTYQLADYPVYALNTNLKQLIKFEELHLREKLIKEEWKRKARFCDGICCLFIFFILVTCSICIFAVLPTVKLTSMVD